MNRASAKINSTPSKEVPEKALLTLGTTMEATPSDAPNYKFTEDFGFKKFGDLLIDTRRDSQYWDSPQDVELLLYCQAANGQNINYAEIKLDLSSRLHEAHIIGGGIGQNYIRILVKARGTYWIRYESCFFGNKMTKNTLINVTE